MLKIKNIHRFSTLSSTVAQLICPNNQIGPYWKTYGVEQDAPNPAVLNDLFQSAVNLITKPLDQNKLLYKQYFKDLQKYKDKQIIHNIEYDMNIELSLREKILQIREELEQNGWKLQFTNGYQFSQTEWLTLGKLEIYGLSPYRHMNHYISNYTYTQQEGQMRFQSKDQPETDDSKKIKMVEALQKPIVETIKQEQTKGFELLDLNRKYLGGIATKVFGEPKQEEHIFDKISRLKQGVQKGFSEQHILVRDYKLGCQGKFEQMVIDSNNEMKLAKQGNLNNLEQSTIIIRTETWMDPHDSEQTKKEKKQVITDINWILRGNPQVFVKRYDLSS